ncbi:MAG: RraA family protein [Burkholderiales bacterium]|nr:RraA family protein [Burkholderiales bacterium]
MIRVNPMPPQVAPALLEKLASLDPVTVGHYREWGFMDPAIRPLMKGRRVTGTAVTIITSAHDTSMIPYAIGLARPGDVLVIDRLGDMRHACMGGVVALAAKVAGVAAVIIDGLACDLNEFEQYGLPLWCRGEAALTGRSLASDGALNVPVACGGVAVLPGQAVLADSGGVYVCGADEIDEICEIGLPMQSREPSTLARLRAGEKLGAIGGSAARIEAALKKQ